MLPLVYFDRPFPTDFHDLLEGRASWCEPDSDRLAEAEAVVAGATVTWSTDLFAQARSLKVISRSGIGYDNVDVAAATAAGIVVCYAPDAPTVSTAEHALALMLSVTKQLPSHAARALAGEAGGPAIGLELDGATLGLVGFGRISRRVAKVGVALGMRVIAHDPFVTDTEHGVELVSLAEVFAQSNVISLHAPSSPATNHMVNADSLAAMRNGVYLINTARGTLVDQNALAAALDSGKVAGAGLDVTDPEPLPVGHPLLGRPNVIVTPHIASSTAAGRRRLYSMAIDNALAVVRGESATTVPGSLISFRAR